MSEDHRAESEMRGARCKIQDAAWAVYQGPLQNVSSTQVLNIGATFLPKGAYVFYFGVDSTVNGSPGDLSFTYDSATVTVQ